MCGSQSACCPDKVVFQEKICGNITGYHVSVPKESEHHPTPLAWVSPSVNDYFQGTFEIFNAGPGVIRAKVYDMHGHHTDLVVTAGNSIAVSVNNPSYFEIDDIPKGTRGKYCINLYKSMYA